MGFDFGSEKVLNITGYFLAFVGLIYFLFNYVPQLSKVTKLILLFSSFLLLLLMSMLISEGNKIRRVLSQIAASIAYLVFLAYMFVNLTLGQNQVFLIILMSSGLLISLSYLLSKEKVDLSRSTSRKAIIVILVLVISLIVFDISADVESSLQTSDQVQVSAGEYNKIADITIENRFIFPRNIEKPVYDACVPGADSLGAELRYQIDETIDGLSTEKYDLEASLESSGVFEVRKSDSCPEEGELATIYVYPSNGFDADSLVRSE